MKIVIPESNNSIIQNAITHFPAIEFLPAPNLDVAAQMVASNQADSMLSGLDFSSRDVLLAYKDQIPLKSRFFSSCFVCQKGENFLVVADGGVNKIPTKDQLYAIVEDTAKTYEAYFGATPKIAMLSYSTKGSGGKNPDLEKIYSVITEIRQNHATWLIDGEMQLDAAIDAKIAAKKTPESPLKGAANILITPDLNSGNILYKALEHLGGWTVAGPIIQGFVKPLADLSRGSSEQDVILTIDVIQKLHEKERIMQ